MLDEDKSIDEIAISALRIMELLQLVKIEKGSLSMDRKYISLSVVCLLVWPQERNIVKSRQR